MKVYFITFLFFVIQINAMELTMIAESNSILSAPGNAMHKELACCYLKESGIDLTEKFVLDIESKTGEVSHLMAALAGQSGLVMGIDSDKNMIKKANKSYGKLANLSFHQDCIKTLEPSTNSIKFHVATLFNYFDLIDDKREVCKRIHKCLNAQGELLVNAGWGKEPFDLEVTREMIESIPLMGKTLSYYGLSNALERPYPTEDEYREIFKDSGFDIISVTKKTSSFFFENPEEFIAMKQPIVMGRPEMKIFPWYMQGWIFNKFIERFLAKLKKNDDGHYIYPIEEILIHARKK
jgi:ubiquinone/menaquinone biosynthesis C-methylase UbiE